MKEVKTINESQIREIVLESVKQFISEVQSQPKTVDDFFSMLENDPRKNTFAYCYYAAPLTMNKTFIDDDGVKKPNPLYGKVIKNTVYEFQFGKTYAEAIAKKNPNWEIQQRKGEFEKVQGFSVLETDKNGKLQLPLADPTTKFYSYILLDDNGPRIVQKEEIAKFCPPKSGSYAPSSGVQFRNLKVDRIYKLSCGGMQWSNPYFEFNEIRNLLKNA